MTRRQTYGGRMAELEREHDEANWKHSLYLAIESQDTALIQELIKEGRDEDYDFPNIPEIKSYLS